MSPDSAGSRPGGPAGLPVSPPLHCFPLSKFTFKKLKYICLKGKFYSTTTNGKQPCFAINRIYRHKNKFRGNKTMLLNSGWTRQPGEAPSPRRLQLRHAGTATAPAESRLAVPARRSEGEKGGAVLPDTIVQEGRGAAAPGVWPPVLGPRGIRCSRGRGPWSRPPERPPAPPLASVLRPQGGCCTSGRGVCVPGGKESGVRASWLSGRAGCGVHGGGRLLFVPRA